LRGRYLAHVRVAYTGSVAEGERLVEPLRAVGPRVIDTLGELPYTESPTIYQDPRQPHPYHGTNAMLRELPASIADTILELVGPEAPVPCVVQLNHLGGALARPPAIPNAVGHREATYLVRVLAVVPRPAPSPEHAAPSRLTGALREHTLGRSPNFVFGERGGPDRARNCYATAAYPRLARIKAALDPANLFRFNLNIPPAEPVNVDLPWP
jgi:Berberine and berberine like